MEEFSKAFDCLACGKAPESDDIPPEALKNGKPVLIQPLHELLCQCYDQGHIHQDMHDANIVTVYKNKEGHSDCNNYWGISLLNIVGKAFARVTLVRLQTLVSHIYPESQCGFRAGRSTVDMIFSLRQLQEKCRAADGILHCFH
ncbi:RNA-directed DNA polymerase from mobile element jockey-like protein [Labeo rohita]|uniref:RNA-directed DNA polymerase from mobile element jockey-like protein n=1 Tax=Labeo rohita TaxID=84645 RepID=A0A498LYG6_LABRO|nr:RNA-directed DNA polymerase from mobile element jockey-like protein [Labeo rohita]